MSTSPATSKALWSASATSLLLLFCPQTTHAAGWSTNIWPSQAYPMEGWRQLQECYTATVERCQATGVSVPSAITSYMSGRSALINLKSSLSAAIPYYMHTNKLDFSASAVASNAFTTIGLTSDDAKDVFPWQGTMIGFHWTATGLCAAVCLPTNYFAFTPYLGLSGLGAVTNDTTVSYPHGFTNSFTINGGSEFPASRTNWYDTDYGLAGYTALVARLLVTDQPYSPNVVATSSYVFASYPPGYSSWASATNSVESRWPALGSIGDWGASTFGSVADGRMFSASMQHYLNQPHVTTLTASLSHQVEFYIYSWFTVGYVYDTYGDHSFASNSMNFVELSAAVTNSTVWGSMTIGSTNKVSPWCAKPSALETYTGRGYYLTGRCAIRWDISGGFTFK